MSQVRHDECWIPVRDFPRTERHVIIWTKRAWLPKREEHICARNIDFGAWYDRKQNVWFHSDGTVAENVTHWMEMPTKPS
jgi:hypothetical protein